MKFRMELISVPTKRKVKQKTFTADNWEDADVIAYDLWDEFDRECPFDTDMRLSWVVDKDRKDRE